MAIRIEQLEVTFTGARGGTIPVLDIPELVIDDGRQVCLVGGSGSGKTTLLNVLAGITLPGSGRVYHGETEITSIPEADRDHFRARNIGFVFQTFNLLQSLTALENVLVAQTFAGNRDSGAAGRARELLERMGLGDRLHSRPATLSVGEQQRVAIARAVANAPQVVLADEPTANLDERNSDEVLALLREVSAEAGNTLVLVTHEERVRTLFDDVLQLENVSQCHSGA